MQSKQYRCTSSKYMYKLQSFAFYTPDKSRSYYGMARVVRPSIDCGCQLMMVVGIVISYWTTMVVSSCSFNASHRRSNGWLLLWWWAVVVFMLIIEINIIIVTGDRMCYWKIDCIIGRSNTSGRSIVVLEDRLFYWKINCIIGTSIAILEDQWYFQKVSCIEDNQPE